MDVVDAPQNNNSIVIITSTNNIGSSFDLSNGNSTERTFMENFSILFESSCLQYKQTNSTASLATGQTDIVIYTRCHGER